MPIFLGSVGEPEGKSVLKYFIFLISTSIIVHLNFIAPNIKIIKKTFDIPPNIGEQFLLHQNLKHVIWK